MNRPVRASDTQFAVEVEEGTAYISGVAVDKAPHNLFAMVSHKGTGFTPHKICGIGN